MIEDVGIYLGSTASTAKLSGATLGTSLFLNNLDSTRNTAWAVYETGGLAPDDVFGKSLPAIENARIQVVARSTSSVTARANIGLAYAALHKVNNAKLSGASTGFTYTRIAAVQSPFFMRRDEKGRHVFACNFDVKPLR